MGPGGPAPPRWALPLPLSLQTVTTAVQRTRPKKDNPNGCPVHSTRTMTPNDSPGDSPAPAATKIAFGHPVDPTPGRRRWTWTAMALALVLIVAGVWYWWPA